MSGIATTIRFGNNLGVIDQGGGAIRVDASGGEVSMHLLASWQGVVPTAAVTGAVWRVPYVDGQAVVFTLSSAYARVEAPTTVGTALKVQKSPPGAFVAADITTLTLAGSANEVQVTTGLGHVGSGDLLRINWTTIGSPGSKYTIEVEGDAAPSETGTPGALATRLPAIEVMAATGFQNQFQDGTGSGEWLTWETDYYDLSNHILAYRDASDPTRIIIPNRQELGLFFDFDFSMVADIYADGKQFNIQPIFYSGNHIGATWTQIENVTSSSPYGRQVMSLEHNLSPYVVGDVGSGYRRERMWARWTSDLRNSDPDFSFRVFLLQTGVRSTDCAATVTIEEHRVDLDPVRSS